jgi:MYXO-CTERM domain-containing protein
MKLRTLVLAAGALLGLSSAAMAQFTAVSPFTLTSTGLQGDQFNGFVTFNYAGPAFQVGDITLIGTATSANVGSSLSELRYRVTAPGGAFFDSGQLIAGGAWMGGVAVTNTQSAASLGMGGAGTWFFEVYETVNQAGDTPDAYWSNLSFTVVPAPGAVALLGLGGLVAARRRRS